MVCYNQACCKCFYSEFVVNYNFYGKKNTTLFNSNKNSVCTHCLTQVLYLWQYNKYDQVLVLHHGQNWTKCCMHPQNVPLLMIAKFS